ncbi:BppU family phage baseplate upper protein [Peribacillus frigoritolerans]|uniref:BppU family phage baseplate upper protein n=1 Tax=Peribacillus frigoritolerans TaxID=450367 RepID=UPI003ECFA775
MAVNEIYKSASIKANVTATASMTKTSIKFTTQDNGTAKLIFNITKESLPLPLGSAATAKIFLRMADGSVFEKDATIIDPVNGQVEYILVEEINHPGTVKGEMNVYFSNGQSMTVCQFQFAIEKTVKDRDIVPVAEYYVKDFNTLQTDIEQRAAVINETVDGMQEKVDAFESTAVTLDPRLTTVEGKVNTVTTQLADTVKKVNGVTPVNGNVTIPVPDTSTLATKTEVVAKADKTYVDSQIGNIGNASPKGTYATLVALQTAFPTGTTGIYIVTADGKWYYWNGSAWTAGGLYQSTGIASLGITKDKINRKSVGVVQLEDSAVDNGNLFNKNTVTDGYYVQYGSGNLATSASNAASDFIEVEPNTTYTIKNRINQSAFYDVDQKFISGISVASLDVTLPYTFVTPSNAYYMRVTVGNTYKDSYIFNKGSVAENLEYRKYSLKNLTVEDKSIKDVDVTKLKQYKVLNLFNKNTAELDKLLNYTTGAPFASTNYFTSDYIKVDPSTSYVRNTATIKRYAFYDSTKTYISGESDTSSDVITTPSNAMYIRISGKTVDIDLYQFEKGSYLSPYSKFGEYTLNGLAGTSSKSTAPYKRTLTLHDAWVNWLYGNKFPVGFLGDSTINGSGTTGYTLGVVGTDTNSPNAFPKKLEEVLRSVTGNNILRIYNAAISATNSSQNGVNNLEGWFGLGAVFNDVKMIGIGHGINDRLRAIDKKTYKELFKKDIKDIIEWCISKNIQPFLLTTQAAAEAGVKTQYQGTYPLRTSEAIETVANKVKKELAFEYGLELIDVNYYTERFLQYSAYTAQQIIPDQLHFGDIGHKYESELMFSQFCPNAIEVSDYTKIDFSSQKITNSVPQDWLTLPATAPDGFKIYANYTKADTTDLKLMTAYVFINKKGKMSLKAYKNNLNSLTYLKINGVISNLTNLETVIGNLDMGLHTIEVFSGASTVADFKGLILE